MTGADPITATLMRDPVVLPSSNMRMDRAVIESHLLDHASDPFNRAPLTIAELTPGTLHVAREHADVLGTDTELKARIDAWMAERKGRKM